VHPHDFIGNLKVVYVEKSRNKPDVPKGEEYDARLGRRGSVVAESIR
jgi:hypothetical protein